MKRTFLAPALSGLLLLLLQAPAPAAAAKPFELVDGDRVAFIGGTFVEREQAYSHLETLLLSRWPERKVTFRNLGWSGDNVFGASRGYFEGADAGFARLTKIVHELKPTVIFIGYGMTESFEGQAGLPSFKEGLGKLLDTLKDLNARETVLIGPISHERLPPPLPDPSEHNKLLQAYSDAMKETADARRHRSISLLGVTGLDCTSGRGAKTYNGIHLNPVGYWAAAQAIAEQLDLPRARWTVTADGRIQAEPGGDASDAERLEKIRQLSIRKNIQFFNQWRPANETYIFGFRAYEQGKNAAEMPQFAKPIEKLEAEMSQIAQQMKADSRREGR